MRKLQARLLAGLTLFGFPAFACADAAPFSCHLRETEAYLYELHTFSGYRWIECRVESAQPLQIEAVAINGGKCGVFDWYSGRTFAFGELLNIPYSCMSPVWLTISLDGGATTKIHLR